LPSGGSRENAWTKYEDICNKQDVAI